MQVYVRGQASAANRAEAQAAFAQLCSSATTSPAADGSTALVRPCAWPHPPQLSSVLEDSGTAALAQELSLLEGFFAQLAALQASGTPKGRV